MGVILYNIARVFFRRNSLNLYITYKD